jgi:hypothetical protein
MRDTALQMCLCVLNGGNESTPGEIGQSATGNGKLQTACKILHVLALYP